MRQCPPDNVFARILSGELPSHELYSDEQVYAFMDIFPAGAGHSLIVPRSYSQGLADAEPQALSACMAAAQRLIPALLEVSGTDSINIMINNGKAAGQTVDYLHFHLIPRYEGDKVHLGHVGPMADQQELADFAARVRAILAS